MAKHDVVTTHLRQWARTPFAWGRNDCCLAVADYLLELTGIDCAAGLRGRYDSRESCDALTGWRTDPVAVMESCLARIPLARALPAAVQRGDVVLCRPVRKAAVAGLALGDGKVGVRGDAGAFVLPLDRMGMMAAWRV